MFYLAAIVSFVLAILFYAWHIHHDVFTYVLFALIGWLCMALAGKWPGWPR